MNGLSRLLTCYITFYQTFEHLAARKYDIEVDSLKILIHITLNSYSWWLRKDPPKNGKMGRKKNVLTFTKKTLVYRIFLIIPTKNDTWKKEHWLLSLTNWMLKSQISNQNGIPYEDSLEENWIKWNLVKAGRVLTICMWANGFFGTSFSSDNLWWRQQKAEIHFRLAMTVFK